jgi:predicted transcriptional regulator
MTVLGRLHEKGMVRRERDGKRFVYHPAKRSAQTKTRFLQRMHRALFNHEKLRPIAALVDADLSREELEELRKLIDAKLSENEIEPASEDTTTVRASSRAARRR